MTDFFHPRNAVVFCLLNAAGTHFLAEHRYKDWDAHKNQWLCPGGKIEPGQGVEDALFEEMRQELGVIPTVYQAFPPVGPDLNDYIVYPFLVRSWVGTLPDHILDTEAELRWLPEADLMQCLDANVVRYHAAIQRARATTLEATCATS